MNPEIQEKIPTPMAESLAWSQKSPQSPLSPLSPQRQRGFTLVEMLLASSVLLVLMGILFSVLNQASGMWRTAAARLDTFQGARRGFDTLTTLLSQATLNTYWDYDDPLAPTRYIRKSELRFECGPTSGVLSGANANAFPAHGVFFHAPAGVAGNAYQGLEGLLNVCGFYVQWSDDSAWLPAHVANANSRERFRLMAWVEPTEELKTYEDSDEWIDNAAITGMAGGTHVIADNILAVLIWPRENGQTTGVSPVHMADRYTYDSYWTSGAQTIESNQLPPVLEVAMVAIDETSAQRLGDELQSSVNGCFEGLFTGSPSSNFAEDLKLLEQNLIGIGVNYRVFSTAIPMKESKWSLQ